MKEIVQLAAFGMLAGLFISALGSPQLAAMLSLSINGFTGLLNTITKG